MQDNRWTDALNMCRTTNEPTLWACLAILATQSNADTLDIAEESYAAIDQYDKVFYIQYLKVKFILRNYFIPLIFSIKN